MAWNEDTRYGSIDPEDLWLDEVDEVTKITGKGLATLGDPTDPEGTMLFLKGCAVVIARRTDPDATLETIGRRVKLGDLTGIASTAGAVGQEEPDVAGEAGPASPAG